MDTFTVSLMTDYGYVATCHPLAIGVDKASAKSIYRHFQKKCHYNNFNQTGNYVVMISRKYCTNHSDYEKETTL